MIYLYPCKQYNSYFYGKTAKKFRKKNCFFLAVAARIAISAAYGAALTDADIFVDLAGFSFSKNEFYESEEAGEGVVTGFATVGGFPVYIAAQNYDVRHGGVSEAGCAKIGKCLELAEKNSTPVIYILNSLGVQIG